MSGGSRMSSQTQASSPSRLRVFLCHSSGDKLAVQNIYWRLKACNVDPWVDKEKLLPGQDWDFEIQKAMRRSDVILICLSNDFIIKEGYGQKEIRLALNTVLEKPEGTIYLIPLKLEECELPERLKSLQAVNYFEEDGFDKLVSALKHRGKSLKEMVEPIDCQERAREFVTEQLPTTSPTDVDRYTVPLQNRELTQALLDLRLPQTLLDLLSKPLADLELTLVEGKIWDPFTLKPRLYTQVRHKEDRDKADQYRYRTLIYIPGRILGNGSDENINAINGMASWFNSNSVVIIVSDLPTRPAPQIRRVLEDEWQKSRQMKTRSICQQEIDELKSLKLEDRKRWVTKELELEELTEGAKKTISVQQMDGNDTNSLVTIIEKLPQLIDEPGRGWRMLPLAAGLYMITDEFSLTGSARYIAWGLVDQLRRRARLPEHPDWEVLGLLLSHILTLKELPLTDSTRIKDIMEKYGLAPLSAEDREHWFLDQPGFREPLVDAKRLLLPSQMQAEDIQVLVQIIASLRLVIDEGQRGWRILLQGAGLVGYISDFRLTGVPTTIAWEMVNRLKNYARQPEQPD